MFFLHTYTYIRTAQYNAAFMSMLNFSLPPYLPPHTHTFLSTPSPPSQPLSLFLSFIHSFVNIYGFWNHSILPLSLSFFFFIIQIQTVKFTHKTRWMLYGNFVCFCHFGKKKRLFFFCLTPNDCKKFEVRVGVGVDFFLLFFCLNKISISTSKSTSNNF